MMRRCSTTRTPSAPSAPQCVYCRVILDSGAVLASRRIAGALPGTQKRGITVAEIDQMAKTNPAKLLGLKP
jgi:hypothetical protein